MSRPHISLKQRQHIFVKTGGVCYYCGQVLLAPNSPHVNNHNKGNEFTIDHIKARANGGTKYGDNIVPACFRCNLTKGDLDIEVFREILGYMANGWPKFKHKHRQFLQKMGIELPRSGLLFWFETGVAVTFTTTKT